MMYLDRVRSRKKSLIRKKRKQPKLFPFFRLYLGAAQNFVISFVGSVFSWPSRPFYYHSFPFAIFRANFPQILRNISLSNFFLRKKKNISPSLSLFLFSPLLFFPFAKITSIRGNLVESRDTFTFASRQEESFPVS